MNVLKYKTWLKVDIMVFLLVITLIFIFLEQAVEVVQPKLGLKQNVLLHWVIADEGGVSDHYLGTYQGDDDGSGGADGGLIVQGCSINGKIDNAHITTQESEFSFGYGESSIDLKLNEDTSDPLRNLAISCELNWIELIIMKFFIIVPENVGLNPKLCKKKKWRGNLIRKVRTITNDKLFRQMTENVIIIHFSGLLKHF